MINKIKDLCPICLEKLNKSNHKDCFPIGNIVIKRENYVLMNINKEEPIIKRVLMIHKSSDDDSKEFLLLYVDNILVGYKSDKGVKFIHDFSKKEHKQILENYIPRKEREKTTFNRIWRG